MSNLFHHRHDLIDWGIQPGLAALAPDDEAVRRTFPELMPTAPRRVRKPAVEPVGLSIEEGAQYLGITSDQMRAFIQDGELNYRNMGRGKKRARYRLTKEDLDDFIEHRKRREPLCQSTGAKAVRSTAMTSSSNVVGFTARRNARLGKTPKNSRR